MSLHPDNTSLIYGVVFALIGQALFYLAKKNPIWAMSITSAFFLVGPFLAVGIYHLSWQIDEGEKPCLLKSIKHIKANLLSLSLFIALLSFMLMV